ncbi:peroxiredoxin-like family protein [Rhizobium leucaenae]|uniref:thioredoxin-dependent peroxiredoxin n=1 Tax=Rhizobium leucaenae TaxID=29450 RepID=A0A7W6ZQN2_9HYPH|nr:peroxiredoxin-like family protein [Rhizobium leucaenae]MBB4566948.1 peroxiredoxin [Rhizobium leucaenae]MBB6300757.1 peroxiredoxin [Rhizobium leucaenae]
MSLQDRLDAFKNDFESGNPPYSIPRAIIDAFHRSTAALIATGQAERALRAGDVAPNFTLEGADGTLVSLLDLLAKGSAVLTFYRGAWCPYCNLELSALQEALPEIAARSASLVAISPQTAPNSRKSIRQHNLTFPMLNDPGNELAAKFGLRWKLSDEMIGVYKTLGADLETFNGNSSWTLPMPARYIIDRDGVIAFSEINPDYTKRPDPSELLPTLDLLASRRAA